MIDTWKQGWQNALKENTPERWILVHILFVVTVIPLILVAGTIGSVVNGLTYISEYLWSLGKGFGDRLHDWLYGEKTFWEKFSWREKGRWLLMLPLMLFGVVFLNPIMMFGDWLNEADFGNKIWAWIKKGSDK